MEPVPVTIRCLYCRREIDGYFYENKKQEIRNLGNGKLLAVVGEWNKKKGYLHAACQTGIEAEAVLSDPGRVQVGGISDPQD